MDPTLKRTTLIVLAAGALGACTTTEAPRPNFPITREAPPAPAPEAAAPAAPGDTDPEPPPKARPTAPVESRPIQPPGSGPVSALPPRAGLIRVATNPRTGQGETRTVAGGRVVDLGAPGKTHTVKAGETVYRIALGFKISPEELARINNLGRQPWVIRPGQVLSGPGGAGGKAYVVADGDTLGDVAQRFGVTTRAIASANDIEPGARLRAGQRLKLPAGYKDKGPQRIHVARATPAPAAVSPQPPSASRPPPAAPAPVASAPAAPPPSNVVASAPPAPAAVAPPPVPVARPAPSQTPPPASASLPPPAASEAPIGRRPETIGPMASVSPTRPPLPAPARPPAPPPSAAAPPTASAPTPSELAIANMGRGRFLWPLRGEIISRYGPQGAPGQRNDGINIRAPAGDVVRAVAAGDVVYAGDQVPGFGNLVLIKHADGWVSAYGHLARLDVRIQERVGQGQQIGLVGASGGAPEPQLHFELRYAATPQDRARPVDPTLVLPR